MEYPLFSVYWLSILPFGCLALPHGFPSGLVLSNSRPQVGSRFSSFDNSSAELGLKPELVMLENNTWSPWTFLRQLRMEQDKATGTCTGTSEKEASASVPLLRSTVLFPKKCFRTDMEGTQGSSGQRD